jgi:uncharacterized damage-inducible protein DinB
MEELLQIANAIDEAITGPVWHGPALRELLENMTAADAAAHPIETAHSTWELVLHMAAWARIVEQRMTSTTLVEPTDAEDWPAVPPVSPHAWQESIASLHSAYHHLATAVRALPPDALGHRVPGRQHAMRTMLRGVVEHASYHGGQIALLTRAMNAHRGRG